MSKNTTGMQPLSLILERFSLDDKGGHITREFQDYGYRLAVELDDLLHTSLYIRLAKTVPRELLEDARTFVLDANATSKAKLFMWKLKQLRQQKEQRKAKKLQKESM